MDRVFCYSGNRVISALVSRSGDLVWTGGPIILMEFTVPLMAGVVVAPDGKTLWLPSPKL